MLKYIQQIQLKHVRFVHQHYNNRLVFTFYVHKNRGEEEEEEDGNSNIINSLWMKHMTLKIKLRPGQARPGQTRPDQTIPGYFKAKLDHHSYLSLDFAPPTSLPSYQISSHQDHGGYRPLHHSWFGN